jgi:hypothetical protein
MEPHVWWQKYGNGECFGKQCSSALSLLTIAVSSAAVVVTTALLSF